MNTWRAIYATNSLRLAAHSAVGRRTVLRKDGRQYWQPTLFERTAPVSGHSQLSMVPAGQTTTDCLPRINRCRHSFSISGLEPTDYGNARIAHRTGCVLGLDDKVSRALERAEEGGQRLFQQLKAAS